VGGLWVLPAVTRAATALDPGKQGETREYDTVQRPSPPSCTDAAGGTFSVQNKPRPLA
jgi:hypothetical protein